MGSPLERAPGRGRYDRARPREDRHSEQRARLIQATAAAFCETGSLPSVSEVVTRAGIGRSTFYEFFDGTEHALNGARDAGTEELKTVLEDSSGTETPLESLRRWMHAWCVLVARRSVLLGVVLSQSPLREVPALALLEARLADYQTRAVQSGSLGQPANDDVLTMIAGGLVTLARACWNDPARTCDPNLLVEFVQRGLRR